MILKSKKFWVTILGIGSIALIMDMDKARLIAQLVMAYVIGQGMADFGKEKNK